jgi:ABC-2 type transport system permease protein
MKVQWNFFVAMFKIDVGNFCRSKGAVFWTFGFPLLLLVIFSAMFGNASSVGAISYRFDDRDGSEASAKYCEYVRYVFAHQAAVQATYAEGGSAGMTIVVPKGFKQQLDNRQRAIVTVQTSQARNLTLQVSEQILASLSDDFVLRQQYGLRGIAVVADAAASQRHALSEINYSAYLVTGLLCMVIASTCLLAFTGQLVQARQLGHFRIFEITPVSRLSVLLAMGAAKFMVILLSALLLLAVGIAAYRLGIPATAASLGNAALILTLGVAGFLGLGLAIAAKVKTQEWAAVITNMVYFPLIFLGNLFIPFENNHGAFAWLDYAPLNLLVRALRGALFYGDSAWHHGAFLAEFALIVLLSLAFSRQAFNLNNEAA